MFLLYLSLVFYVFTVCRAQEIVDRISCDKWHRTTCSHFDQLVNQVSDLETMLRKIERAVSQATKVTIYKDCTDVGDGKSGVYKIQPSGSEEAFDVYCDMDTDGGGWTVFQRRQDGSENFYRGWVDYETGFGSLTGEFWLGNLKIHNISRNSPHELWIDLADFENNTRYAKYSGFSLGDKSTNYILGVSGYSGTAGDGMRYHNQRPFSTRDRDNDAWTYSCAVLYKGAWWYGYCRDSNLNGQYLPGDHLSDADGVIWYPWRGYNYSLKTTEIKIRKIA